MASREEVAASMARIKALQAMLAGGGAPEPEEDDDDYDPNDPNNQYQETEDDEKWREEQEKEWERQQALEREAAAKAKAEVTSDDAPAAAPSSSPATAAPASSSSSSSLPVPPASGPHQWSSAQLADWLLTEVRADLTRRADVFAQKGWTKDELSKWRGEVESAFATAKSKLDASQLTGAQAAAFDINSDSAWGQHLAITDPFIRAAVWANWKQALRKWQQTQQK